MDNTLGNLVDVLKNLAQSEKQGNVSFTPRMFTRFLNKLIELDKDIRVIIAETEETRNARKTKEEQRDWAALRTQFDNKTSTSINEKSRIISDRRKMMAKEIAKDISEKNDIFLRLQKCNEAIARIHSIEKSLTVDIGSEGGGKANSKSSNMTVDEIISDSVRLMDVAYEINANVREGNKKDIASKTAQLHSACKKAKKSLNEEISKLKTQIVANKKTLHSKYGQLDLNFYENIASQWNDSMSMFDSMASDFANQRFSIKEKTKEVITLSDSSERRCIDKKIEGFCNEFLPKKMLLEYSNIYSNEPSHVNYECAKEMPKDIYISNFEYDVSSLDLCEVTKEFLRKHYYFMFRGSKLLIPHCVQFGSEFNYIFKFDGDGRANVVKDACDMGMRLFMMLPPGKVNFTFVDPVTLGESFAMFTRLVDVDDRTSEVINGKIWSTPSDIEEKLNIMTNHISNVTQRCLQGKYENIFEYNKVAEQNAEAYQIIMLMDYPAGLNEKSLKLLEQIATSGPKCGVFTVIYRNESQFKKASTHIQPLINSIESNFTIYDYTRGANQIVCSSQTVKNQAIKWNGVKMPASNLMDGIIATLKQGIKDADKVVIDIEKVNAIEKSKNEKNTNSTRNGIRIPIGIHGANEVQYLTLGVGGSHHALVAGVAGSGKSSLLHTIILRTLMQYSPEELVIYLVDFKRGVEFKIYADFTLPSFKVVAIESEREFGYNILAALEREQRIRADLFRKSRVDKIEEYRDLGKKMPRVLVIMDEFHELFINENDDLAKKSAIMMERIVRQGRAFGVHMILASQSYSNIKGVDKTVYDQMAVRIVLKCSKTDANLLLDEGSTEIDQISIDDPGRAVYNSEAGNKEYNSHFRVAYIEPEKHRGMLQSISDETIKFADPKQPTRILLSNIEDNNYSIFNQFAVIKPEDYDTPGRLYIGEPLSITNNIDMDFARKEHSNMLMIGSDTEKARSMFAFGILSLCVNYRIKHQKAPETPFIYLINCKPLNDSYFKDTPKLLSEILPEYIKCISRNDENEVQNVLSELHSDVSNSSATLDDDKYVFVFGYQGAEVLKYEKQLSRSEDMNNLFNINSVESNTVRLSPKEMFHEVVINGPQKGIHTVIWQDSFEALYQDDKDIMSYFSMKIAFDMAKNEEYSRFIGANDIGFMNENNAIYYNRACDNQKFRPYQSPDEEWLRNVAENLK